MPNFVPDQHPSQLELCVKEWRETLRDRRTILTLLIMPVLLYPILGMGFRFLALQKLQEQKPVYRLLVDSEEDGEWMTRLLGSQSKQQTPATVPDQLPNPTQKLLSQSQFELYLTETTNPVELVERTAAGEVELGLFIDQGEDQRAEVQMVIREDSPISLQAADRVARILEQYNLVATTRVAQMAIEQWAPPVKIERSTTKATGSRSAILTLLPLVLLLMTVTGGVYPAIDLTAGERERNTMEAVMALPIPVFRILIAKYSAVLLVTMMTGLVNLLAMFLTVYSLQMETILFGDQGLSATLGMKLFGVLLVFSLFYSAVLLTLTSTAKSFKEAQVYLIPLLLFSITPGLIIVLPGWYLNTATAFLPVMNMLLLARELFESEATFLPALLSVVMTLFYALIALLLATRLFGADAYAVGSQGSWNDLLKRPERSRLLPSVQEGMFLILLTAPAFLFSSGILSRIEQENITSRLILSSCLTITLFGLLPWALARWQKLKRQSTFLLRSPGFMSLAAGLLIGFSTWPLIYETTLFTQQITGWGISLEKSEQVSELLARWQATPLPVILLCLAFVPAACEEWFFRGFLLSSLKSKVSVTQAVIYSSLCFGLFHLILSGGLAPERLLPSTLMGLMLGFLALRSNSLFPGILAHALHNGSLLTLAYYRNEMTGAVWQQEGTHLPQLWLLGSAVCVLIGLIVLSMHKTERVEPSES